MGSQNWADKRSMLATLLLVPFVVVPLVLTLGQMVRRPAAPPAPEPAPRYSMRDFKPRSR